MKQNIYDNPKFYADYNAMREAQKAKFFGQKFFSKINEFITC